LKKSKHFLAGENDLEGELPEEFGKLSQLVDLDFDANFKIRGHIPFSLSLLTKLETFDLDNNILVGEIPESFYDCSALERLDLDHNMLTGTLSSRFSEMSNLNLLFLDNNMLSGSIPSQWGNTLGGLKFLTLDSNMLFDLYGPVHGKCSETVARNGNNTCAPCTRREGRLKYAAYLPMTSRQPSKRLGPTAS